MTPAIAEPVLPARAVAAGQVREWRVGSLRYTASGLINVFTWMLWGDLCLNVMESAIPRLVPLQMDSLGLSSGAIGILTGSVFSLMNWFMNPVISTWSDRHRSRLGRRMPFMLYPTPFLALFLVAVGFSDSITAFLHVWMPALAALLAAITRHLLPSASGAGAAAQTEIGCLAVTLIVFKFFDLFPNCVYYYLLPDIVPQEVMGTFICLFRLVATLGTIAFHYWLLPIADHRPHLVYLVCGALYLFAFILLPLRVKEGDYPPPAVERATKSARHPLALIRRWFAEVFSSSFYWKYFLTSACSRWTFVPFNTFVILFAKRRLGLDAGEFGHLMAVVLLLQMPVLLFLGPVLDRFHPLRVGIVGSLLSVASGLFGFFLIHDRSTFLLWTFAAFFAVAVLNGAVATMGPRLLPRQQYGQFCAANAMVNESGMLLLSWLCGVMLDRFGDQTLYLWFAFFGMAGAVFNGLLYAAWREAGGDRPDHAIASFTVPEADTGGSVPLI